MQVGMIGLGRMGTNMAKRLLRGGHDCVVYDRDPAAVSGLTSLGATGASSFGDLVERLRPPRAIWLMIPAAVVESAILELAPLLAAEDVLVDGGNSFYQDDIRRAKLLAERGVHYLDVGTSGGVWGLERGYCQMIGGDAALGACLRSESIACTLSTRAGSWSVMANHRPQDGEFDDVVHGLLVRARARSSAQRRDSTLWTGLFALVNGGLSTALMAFAALATGEPLVFPSLGPTPMGHRTDGLQRFSLDRHGSRTCTSNTATSTAPNLSVRGDRCQANTERGGAGR